MDKAVTLKQMEETKLVAVVRTRTAEQALRTAEAIILAGLTNIEITYTVPQAGEVLRKLAASLGQNAVLGAGTVLTREQGEEALATGARFLVSPITDASLAPLCLDAGAVWVPGALTPTEVVGARRAGADVVKVFPVDMVGGPRYIKALQGPLPDVPLLVSGGVGFDNFQEYLKLGVRLVALGSDLMPAQLVEAGDYGAITEHARRFVDAVQTP